MGIRRNLLRPRSEGRHERVGFIELFFDLVFVFAVTQVSHALIEHPDPVGFLQAGMLFVALWWVWVDTAWVTNWLDVRHMPVRLLLIVLMATGMLMAISLPEAFRERGLVFAITYVVTQIGRNLFMILALRHHNRDNHLNFIRIFLWSLAEAPFWIAGALVEDAGQRMALWAIGLAIVSTGPIAAFWVPGLGRSDTATWDVEGHHFSERCGLFIIIALGESILITGATFAETEWALPVVVAFAAAFVGTVAMWWLYFDTGATRAARLLAQDKDPGRMARLAYTYFHIPIVAGIIVTAASDEMALAHPTGHAGAAEVAALIGGPALYLFGNLIFKRTSGSEYFPLSHIVGLCLLGAMVLPATRLSPAVISLAVTAILVIVAVWELISLRETRAELQSE
ncbi:low temperature requirement protein A [Allosphingosinicella sp.]|uniref:low temperature requirement protein A n=1 Tax=Allosphingosinicella sp. TaxID=2823234 RepID=UPI002ED7AC9D